MTLSFDDIKLLHLERVAQCRLESDVFFSGVDVFLFVFFQFQRKNNASVISNTCSEGVQRGGESFNNTNLVKSMEY